MMIILTVLSIMMEHYTSLANKMIAEHIQNNLKTASKLKINRIANIILLIFFYGCIIDR